MLHGGDGLAPMLSSTGSGGGRIEARGRLPQVSCSGIAHVVPASYGSAAHLSRHEVLIRQFEDCADKYYFFDPPHTLADDANPLLPPLSALCPGLFGPLSLLPFFPLSLLPFCPLPVPTGYMR